MLRKVLYHFFRFLFRLLTTVKVENLHYLPASGGALLATNHLSRLEPPLLYCFIPRKDVTALVASKYKTYPFIRMIVTIVDGIWIDRENPEPSALREAIQFLRNGGLIGIAPEGTRSQTQALLRGKPGVAYLATKAGVPIIPVAFSGTETAVKKLLRFQRPKLIMRLGEPFTLPPLDRLNREDTLQRNADEIMCRIAALLPDQYHGVYAGNPRIAELRDGKNAS